MDYQAEILDELLVLDRQEQFAKEIYETSGEYMNMGQYLYLLQQSHISFNRKQLYTPDIIIAQLALVAQFHEKYADAGLPEADFFPEGVEVTAEKVPRYTIIQNHKHQFFECAYVVTGSCIHVVDGIEYIQSAGNIISIITGTNHEIRPVEDCLCITIKVRTHAFVRMDVPNMIQFLCPTLLQCGNDPFVRSLFLTLYAQQSKERPYQGRMCNLLFETLMVYVVQNFWDTVQYLVAHPMKERKWVEVINYIVENYQTVTLQSLAEKFHYNESYLSNKFRLEAGKPFSKMLRSYKLMRAADILSRTNLKINDVCDAVGYKDPVQFTRNFKEQYGITPAKYRKQMREETQSH